ncbi:MAG TPA: nucleoside recognition domain-containing protein [Syntrophomonadaceae bacterium]|nr:nucleoside recognition domain-containing protein [Syntrophomonadaceae bacterium]HPR93220.1 nucleoside recognition domain-containing protein [Syntrophomonadaceae bacterium]
MPYTDILTEAVTGSIASVLKIAAIVIPLMIFIEIIQDLNWLEKITALLTPITRFIGISPEAKLPIMAGLVFGISYGGGIIIDSARQGKLTYRDIYLINLFLVICHSLFEDTILFAAIGAIWLPVLILRIIMAIVICWIVARFMPELPEKAAGTLV